MGIRTAPIKVTKADCVTRKIVVNHLTAMVVPVRCCQVEQPAYAQKD